MTLYIFKGLVLPERAQFSCNVPLTKVIHVHTQKELKIELSIVLNQITVWVNTDSPWNDISTLRNIVRNYVNSICSYFAFLKGYAYDIEIRQVLNKELKIDIVFGIDTPCISSRHTDEDLIPLLNDIMKKSSGKFGLYIHRCFNDLQMALKDTEDTAFYCYRAIESLKQYCKYKYQMEQKSELEQWTKVSELTGYNKEYIEDIRTSAFPARHGDIKTHSDKDRENILTKTWNVVEKFIEKIES